MSERDVQPPLVSIVIPTKDRPTHVVRAVRCALGQREASVEVIVVDDGSAKPVGAVLADELRRAGDRLLVVRNATSRGVAAARNRGAALAHGDWIGFCDDDDMWAPSKVRAQLDAADPSTGWSCSAAVTVVGDFCVRSYQPAPDPRTIDARLLAGNPIPGGASSVMVRAALFRELGGFDTAFATLADWDLWVRLAQRSPLAVVDPPLVAYLVQPQSMSSDTAVLHDEFARLMSKHDRYREHHGVRFDWRRWHRYVGVMEVRAGRRLQAATRFWRAAGHGDHKGWLIGVAVAISPKAALAQIYGDRRRAADDGRLAEAEEWIRGAVAAPTD